jgi:putative membrane protein
MRRADRNLFQHQTCLQREETAAASDAFQHGIQDAGLNSPAGTSREMKRSSVMADGEKRINEHGKTALSEDRTLLAGERTFAGWTRTSLGCIAVGVGFHALFSKMQPAWVPRAIATLFLALAVTIVWLAARRATSAAHRLDAHVVVNARPMNFTLLAVGITFAATALAVAIWLLPLL